MGAGGKSFFSCSLAAHPGRQHLSSSSGVLCASAPPPPWGGGAEDPLRFCARGRFGGGVSSNGRHWSPSSDSRRNADGRGPRELTEAGAAPGPLPPRLPERRAPPRRPARPRACRGKHLRRRESERGATEPGGRRVARAGGSARWGGGRAADGAIQGFSCSHCPAELPPCSEASLQPQVTYTPLHESPHLGMYVFVRDMRQPRLFHRTGTLTLGGRLGWGVPYACHYYLQPPLLAVLYDSGKPSELTTYTPAQV